jgi:hypothetical protein
MYTAATCHACSVVLRYVCRTAASLLCCIAAVVAATAATVDAAAAATAATAVAAAAAAAALGEVGADALAAGPAYPQMGHLTHMSSHAYLRTGRWHDAVHANQLALQADEAQATKWGGGGLRGC